MTDQELVVRLAGYGFERLLRDGPPEVPSDPTTAALVDAATTTFNGLRRDLESLCLKIGIPSVWG